MSETELVALHKKWIIQIINEASSLRLLRIAYGFLDRLFSDRR